MTSCMHLYMYAFFHLINMNQQDLKFKTLNFSKQTIQLCRALSSDTISKPIINQLIRSATSVGANYREACAACSALDFRHKIYICRKEAEESEYWIQLLFNCFPNQNNQIQELFDECKEVKKIFCASTMTIEKSRKLNNE